MKPELLNDVLSEGEYSAFRDKLAGDFRAEVRSRSHRRKIFLAMAASIAFLAAILFYPRSHQSQTVAQALPLHKATSTFETSRLKPEEIVSARFTALTTIETQPPEMVIITTFSNHTEMVNDAELLALFPDHPIGIVSGSNGRKFVFVNPDDAQRYMSSN
ncbi:MAG TPA: hypothetical protein VI282_19655 [Verrucomicrobiae bacterium]